MQLFAIHPCLIALQYRQGILAWKLIKEVIICKEKKEVKEEEIELPF